jgi:hypothetical protein
MFFIAKNLCVLHCCTKHVQCQKCGKYFLFTQSPPFKKNRILEPGKVASKHVQIMHINASYIILSSFHIRRNGLFYIYI